MYKYGDFFFLSIWWILAIGILKKHLILALFIFKNIAFWLLLNTS